MNQSSATADDTSPSGSSGTQTNRRAELGAVESRDDTPNPFPFQDQLQGGEFDIQQLYKEVCQLRITIQELLSQSTKLDHKILDLSNELLLLNSLINDKRCSGDVQKLVEFQERLKDPESLESGSEPSQLLCEEEFSNISRSTSEYFDFDNHLADSGTKLNSLKQELATKMRLSFTLRCRLNDVPIQAELIQYERRISELYTQMQEKHRLTRRYYATYNSLLEIKELMLKESSLLNSINIQFKDAMTTPIGRSKLLDSLEVIANGTKHKLEKAKLGLLTEQEVFKSLEEKHNAMVAEERHFSALLKMFQDACTEYEKLREDGGRQPRERSMDMCHLVRASGGGEEEDDDDENQVSGSSGVKMVFVILDRRIGALSRATAGELLRWAFQDFVLSFPKQSPTRCI